MFDLPDSYFQNTEVTDRISQLMQYTLLTVLELEFQPIYRQNWWERELKPHILQMDAGYDTFAGTDKQKPTVAKYRQLMNNLRHAHKVEPDLADLDVTALSTVLLYDDTYKDLDIRQYVPLSQKKYRSVLKVKNCRNGFSHGDVESRQQARDQGLQELRILMQLYDCSNFGPDLVHEVFHYDPAHPSAGRQAELARQQEFGRFYNSFLAASTQLEQPQTRRAALDSMRQLAQAGFRTAMGRVMDVVLHDPQYFSLQEAVQLLADRNDLTRDELAQLTLLRGLLQKEEAARAGDASAAMEMAQMACTQTSPIYTPGREFTYYLWAWQADHQSGMTELQAAAQRGVTSAWDALCQTRDSAAMDWLADRLHSGALPGGKSWEEISPWLFRLSDQGSRRALAILVERMGMSNSCCCLGPGDPDRCRVCRQACEAGYLNVLVHRLRYGKEPCNNSPEKRSETLALCQDLAKRDPAAGQVALASCMIRGIGTPYDPEQAGKLLSAYLASAAETPADRRGIYAAALYWSGHLCEYGSHPDMARAMEYYRKAAACGDFPMAGVPVFMQDATNHDPKVRRAAYETLTRLEKYPTNCVRLGFHLAAYGNLSITDGFLRRNPWIKNMDHVRLALWEKWSFDSFHDKNNSHTVSLFINLALCKTQADILPVLRSWLQDRTPAASQLEALYLLTQPQPDLPGARKAWNKATSFRQKPLPASGVRDHGVFRSHGRKDRIAQALQTGVAPEQLYDLLKSSGFRIPRFRLGNTPVLMGVFFSENNPFYRWLTALYLDRYEQERTALVTAAQSAKQARMRWFELEKFVQKSGRPGLPDRASAVRLYQAEQGDAEAMQILLDSRANLTGLDRLHRNLALADLIFQGRAPGGHTGEEGRALLMECLDHVPDSHARAAVLCTLGRYETDSQQRTEWFRRAQNIDPEGVLPCAALIDEYLNGKDYQKAVQQADRFWFKLNLQPYKGRSLSTAWPSTRALLNQSSVNAWAVAMGQKAYLALLNNDKSLTSDNRTALKHLSQMDPSVGDWRIYKEPSPFDSLSSGLRLIVSLSIILLVIFVVLGIGEIVLELSSSLFKVISSTADDFLSLLLVAAVIWYIYRHWKK